MTGIFRAVKPLREELALSPNLQGVTGAATSFGAARASGLSSRAAAGVALAAGLGLRTACSWRHEMRRTVTNSADSVMVAGWLADTPALTGGWAIEPDFGRLVIQDTLTMPRPGVVIECGSGTTTLLIARALRERDAGRLYSIESDQAFADQTWRSVKRAGLEDWVEPILAPVEQQQIGPEAVAWYSVQKIDAALPPDAEVDLLVVDGPPMLTPLSRWPAVEVLLARLSGGAKVLLDDGRRGGERRTASRWSRDHPELELAFHDTVKGTWRLVKRADASPRRGAHSAVLTARALLTPLPSGDGRWPKQR